LAGLSIGLQEEDVEHGSVHKGTYSRGGAPCQWTVSMRVS
jgi:hypothetical protein